MYVWTIRKWMEKHGFVVQLRFTAIQQNLVLHVCNSNVCCSFCCFFTSFRLDLLFFFSFISILNCGVVAAVYIVCTHSKCKPHKCEMNYCTIFFLKWELVKWLKMIAFVATDRMRLRKKRKKKNFEEK